jgi:vanadium chloroperoxidase
LIGVYWAYDGANRLGTPPRFYNQIIREIAMKRSNTEADNARLFAFVNAALGDAGILAWEQKYCHDFWRPVVGIREHDQSFGPGAEDPGDAVNDIDKDADPFWLPFGAPSTNSSLKNFTPNFPAYPSGHATFGAAAFHVARLFYGRPAGDRKPDELAEGLGFVSDELNGRNRDNRGTVRPRHVRKFDDGLWQMIVENARSRVFLGVHWVFDAFAEKNGRPDLTKRIGGVRLGVDIAEDMFAFGAMLAPKMTPDTPTAKPPLTTPAAFTTAMPTFPAQPSSVARCADNRDAKGAKETGREMVTDRYPKGRSPR